MRLATAQLALLSWLFGACCGGTPGNGSANVPRALRERAESQEVVPFDGFPVTGLELYRVSGSVPDHGWSFVVGIDAGGRLVEREALMRRLGPLEPAVLASRALAVLLGQLGQATVNPSDPRSQFSSEDEWSVITAPRREGDEVVFFLMEGEMHPTLNEVRVDANTFVVSHRAAADLVLASGRNVSIGPEMCAPISLCGCWSGCGRFEPFRVPNESVIRYLARDGSRVGTFYAPAPACTGNACARTCRIDMLDATCDAALLPTTPEECTEACPPSEAPYHCDTLVTGCRRIEHPVRMPERP
jgi:hypothetical protein